MEELLEKIREHALVDIKKTQSADELYQIQVKYLGRKGELTVCMQQLPNLSSEERPKMGRLCNEVKTALEEAFAEKQEELSASEISKKLTEEWVDITAPGTSYEIGHIHPISAVQHEVEQIFERMGFAIMDGPEAESEYYNFEGLNIPAHHPARDMQDTFFLGETKVSPTSSPHFVRTRPPSFGGSARDPQDPRLAAEQKKHGRLVLRTHTSPVQVRTMEKYGAPLRVIVPGRVFRNEATDARHEHTFNQVEGLLVDTDISLAHLKGVMQEFLSRLFGRSMKVRLRPGYFPFVEPGVELDISCTFCGLIDKNAKLEFHSVSRGCKVCKYTGWIEFMGAGMVHPNVLRAGKIDPKKYQGWAFGFGLTRLTMMRFGIDDIRLLSSGDIRFLEQF